MNVREEVKRAIKYGIYIQEFSLKEEKQFISELFKFLINKKNFCILRDDDRTIMVSSIEEELAEVFVHAGTLKIIPQSNEGYFEVFMDVLEFIANRHKEEMKKLSDVDDDDESTEEDGEIWL
tara:strand:- start:110 stop:475 length:366 start_codon:yes stop_codon:yes gene_type:complete